MAQTEKPDADLSQLVINPNRSTMRFHKILSNLHSNNEKQLKKTKK